MQKTPRHAFTVLELLVVIGIIGLLLGILLPAVERVRHRGYLQACASHLRSIGQAVSVYASEHRGQFPRTRYVPDAPLVFGTGAASANAFGPTGPDANDVTAAFYLLCSTQQLPTTTFVCPYDDVFEYESDPQPAAKRSNFGDVSLNLGYSLADPYPSAAAQRAGYVWNATLGETFPLASDKNPGIGTSGDDVTADLTHNATKGCSLNHERDGQNVLYADGHVQWQSTPLCGPLGDNIFTNRQGKLDASPIDRNDALLLPTDDPR